MKMRLYAVRDLVAECLIGAIIMEREEAPAIRGFRDAVLDGESTIGRHPRDYELLYLGDINDSSGKLAPLTEALVTVTGSQILDAETE